MLIMIRNVNTHAFGGRGLEKVRTSVDTATDSVRVFDSVADVYTSCHSIPPSTADKLRRLARRAVRHGQTFVDWSAL